ncbi:MAG: hypothetical protein R8K48_00760 [Gallionella sp.]
MRYHNGHLRNEQDATLFLSPDVQKCDLCWKEYIPFLVLATTMVVLVMGSLFL